MPDEVCGPLTGSAQAHGTLVNRPHRFRFTPEPVAYGATSDDGDPATTNERTEAK